MSVDQILDRVLGYNPSAVLDMQFDDPARTEDFSVVINDSSANFTTCKITAIDGLWCLDGKNIRHWADPANPGASVTEFGCDDPTLGLDTKKSNTCTSMTVDAAGAVYIAGKNKGKTHSLIKVVEKDSVGDCPAGFTALTEPTNWCASQLAMGRPLVVDMLAVDGDVADEFNPSCPSCTGSGKGTILLEQRTSAVFVTDSGETTEIAGGKGDWTFQGNEKLQSLALLQTDDGSGGFDSFVLATTTKDRILAVDTDGTPDGREVFDIADKRSASSTACNSDDQHYGVRTSSKSGVIYVTDRNFCEFLALEPTAGWPGTGLQNVQEDGSDLTLSTVGTSESFGLTGPTLAPGVAVDLSQCGGVAGCALAAGATLSGVQLASPVTGLTLFQITGIPDCRASLALQEECRALLGLTSVNELFTTGIILDQIVGHGEVGSEPAAQNLNIAPLFPQEIKDLFPEGLPDMWVQRWVRAQVDRGDPILDNHFEAFLGITDATFTGAATLEMLVADLTGSELGCPTVTPPENTPVSVLRNYDVAAKVSEDFISINRDFIPGLDDHESHLINTDCGSTFARISRWSLVIINGEFPEDTYDEVADTVTTGDPAIFARLLLSLFDDLVDAVDQLACNAVDGQASAPLSGSTCANFAGSATVALDKIDKCIDATKEPKNSQRNQNCQAAESQLNNLEDEISMFALAGEDPANRIGEALVRVQVVRNVFTNLFFPSIPDAGFTGL